MLLSRYRHGLPALAVALLVLSGCAGGRLWHPALDATTVAAVLAALLLAPAVLGAVRHCARRFGGLSGDVLGACVELVTACYAVLCCVRTVR